MTKLIARVASRLALLALLPLLLAACFRVDLAITVNDDGSGTMAMLVAFDQSLLGLFDALAGDEGTADDEQLASPLDLLDSIDPSQLPAGVVVEPYLDGDFVGARIVVPFEPGEDVAATLEEAFTAIGDGGPIDAGSSAPLEALVLSKQDDGGWLFEALVPSFAADAAGGDALDSAMTELLLGNATFTVRMRLPGKVSDTNADEQSDDGELIWHIDPAGDERVLIARTRPDGGAPAAALLVAAAAATAIAVGAIGYWVRRRAAPGEAGAARSGDPAGAGPPPQPPAATGAG